MRVLVLCNQTSQASHRVRVAALQPGLAAEGVHLHVQARPRGWQDRRLLLERADEFDAVLLQRTLLGPLDAALLRRRARRVLFDVDDAIMFDNGPIGLAARARRAVRLRATAAILDHAVCGNDYLADQFRRRGVDASVLPTVVDVERYGQKQHAVTDRPTLVWIGSRSTLPYLVALMPALAVAAARVPGLRLITIADATVEAAPLPVEHRPWRVDDECCNLLLGDIGIAPTPDDPWTRGKCGFKLLQYMASGLPTIASPVGANAEIVVDGETGLLARADADWPRAIERLASDVAMRRRMGEAGRDRAKSAFAVERAVEAWANLLRR